MPLTNATPPPMGGAKSPTRSTSTKKLTLTEQRTEAVAGLGQLAQVPLLAMKQYADAGAVGLYWPNVAKEVATLADSQPAIANIVDPLMKIGPYTGLVAAILPFLMQIAVNHGRVAPGSMGTVPASTLEAQIKTAMAQAELEALRTQMEAENAAAALRKEMEESRKALADAMSDHAHETADVA